MPISLEPDEKRLFWLRSDADKPLEARPVFVCAAPTRRIIREHRRLRAEVLELEKAEDEASRDRAFEKMMEMIGLGVVGARNMGGELPNAECRMPNERTHSECEETKRSGDEETKCRKSAHFVSSSLRLSVSSSSALEDLLTESEIVELAFGWPTAFELTENDRKNSCSPRPSAPGPSAPSAEGPAGNA